MKIISRAEIYAGSSGAWILLFERISTDRVGLDSSRPSGSSRLLVRVYPRIEQTFVRVYPRILGSRLLRLLNLGDQK
jgi:hypothetical protein